MEIRFNDFDWGQQVLFQNTTNCQEGAFTIESSDTKMLSKFCGKIEPGTLKELYFPDSISTLMFYFTEKTLTSQL